MTFTTHAKQFTRNPRRWAYLFFCSYFYVLIMASSINSAFAFVSEDWSDLLHKTISASDNSSMSLSAELANCLDPFSVDAVNADFDIEIKHPFDPCDSHQLTYSFFKAAIYLKTLAPLNAMGSKFSLGIVGANPYLFFKKRAQKIKFLPKIEDCNAAAKVEVGDRKKRTISICQRFSKYSPLIAASILLHEARHLDGSEFSHQPCISGINQGRFSCDGSYRDGGSYAVDTDFLISVSQTRHLDEKTRRQAKQSAIQNLQTRFNSLPFDSKSGALLIKGNKVFFYHQNKLSPLPLNFKSQGIPALLSGTFTVYSSDEVFSHEHKNIQVYKEDVLSYHFLKESSDRQDVVDVVYGKTYVCLLKTSELRCSGQDRKFFSKKFNHFKARRFVKSSRQVPFIGANTINILSSQDELYTLPKNVEELKVLDPILWQKRRGSFDMMAVGRLQRGISIVLDTQGRVRTYQRRSRHWDMPLPQERFEWLLSPYVWSEQLFNEL